MMENIGQKLRELRGEKSVTEVANAVGIAQSTLSMYENGERIPRDSIKVKLAKYFGVSIEELFYANK
jgi:transcriptional regulator with XRE-family HTH domain